MHTYVHIHTTNIQTDMLTLRALAKVQCGFFIDLGIGEGVAASSSDILWWYFLQQYDHCCLQHYREKYHYLTVVS